MTTGTVIARGGLELRKLPKTGTVRATLRRGTHVEVLEKETWLRVRTRDGKVGYVLADLIELSPEDLFPVAAPEAITELPVATQAARAGPAPAAATASALSDVCDIRIYRNSRFIGNELRADLDFFPWLDRLNQFATDGNVEIFVTSSTREPGRTVNGAIVPPAARSNHLVGHAIDMNLRSGNRLFNSTALKRSNLPNLPPEVRRFIEAVRGDGTLRWGGDFNPEDPVHIDDGLNLRDEARWDSKFASRR